MQQNKGKSGKESFPETQLCSAGQTAQGCSSQLSVTEYCWLCMNDDWQFAD